MSQRIIYSKLLFANSVEKVKYFVAWVVNVVNYSFSLKPVIVIVGQVHLHWIANIDNGTHLKQKMDIVCEVSKPIASRSIFFPSTFHLGGRGNYAQCSHVYVGPLQKISTVQRTYRGKHVLAESVHTNYWPEQYHRGDRENNVHIVSMMWYLHWRSELTS